MASSPEIVVRYTADTKGLSKGLGSVKKSSDGIGKALKTGGVAAAAGIAIAGVAVKKFVGDASNLNESVNAVEVTFGKASKTVLDFSRKAATEAGLSMREFNELVTPVGAGLINVGYSADQAADASVNLATRAADMASVFNTDVSEAMTAIQAGLRGEADPLERFGVGLSDAAVKAEAMSMGLAKSEKALTAQDKAQARVNLLMKQTDRLAGDFKNTSDGLANAQRVIAAEFENISASIGGVLLPVFARAASGFAGFLGKLGDAKGAGAKFKVVVDGIKGLLSTLGETFRTAIQKIDWQAIFREAKGIGEGIEEAVRNAPWSKIGKRIGAAIAAAVAVGVPAIRDAFAKAFEIVNEIDWVAVGRAMGPGLAAAVATAFVTLTDVTFWIKNWDLALAVLLATFTRGIGGVIGKLALPLRKLGSEIILKILVGLEAFAPRIEKALFQALAKLPAVIHHAIGPIIAAMNALWSRVSGVVASAMGRIGRIAFFTLKVLGIQAAINAIVSFARKVIETVKKIPGAIAQIAADAATAGFQIGQAAVQGMINGIVSLATSLYNKAKEIAQGAWNAAKAAIGAKSPSILWAQLGADSIRGYIVGIDTEVPKLNAKTAEAVTKALDAARAVVERSQDSFRTAFDKLGEFAGRAFEGKTSAILDRISARFDAAIAKWQGFADKLTPAEKQLAAMAAAEEKRQRDTALAEAQAAVAAAQTEAEKTAALEQLRQANLANERAALEAQAANERVAQEKRAAEEIKALEKKKTRQLQNAEERRRQEAEKLDEQLANLRERLAKHPEEHEKIQRQIIRVLQRHGVSMKKAGKDLGEAFAQGLRDSAAEVERAAENLARIVAKYLPHSPAEKGPLSRDDFFKSFGSMLARNMLTGIGALQGAAHRMASAAVPAGGIGMAAGLEGSGSPMSVRVFIGETELTHIVRTEIVRSDTGLARTLLAGARG